MRRKIAACLLAASLAALLLYPACASRETLVDLRAERQVAARLEGEVEEFKRQYSGQLATSQELQAQLDALKGQRDAAEQRVKDLEAKAGAERVASAAKWTAFGLDLSSPAAQALFPLLLPLLSGLSSGLKTVSERKKG